MEHVPYTSAVIAPHILRYLRLVAVERGHDLEPALRRAGLNADALDAVELRVSYRQGSLVIREALAAIGDPGLGLAVGSRQHAASWGVLGLALMTADTVQDGVELATRYQQQAGSLLDYLIEPDVGPGPAGLAVVATMRDPAADAAVEAFLVDEAFASIVVVVRDVLGGPFRPESVQIRSAPPPAPSAHADLLGVRPAFGRPQNRLVIGADQLGRRPRRADPWVFAQAVAVLASAEPSDRERQELVQSLEVLISRALPQVPPLADQAHRLLTSERTLRRRLAASGTSYAAIVDGVRAAVAQRLISADELPLDEIARRVGYSDGRALRRAVTRWTGSAPSALRPTSS